MNKPFRPRHLSLDAACAAVSRPIVEQFERRVLFAALSALPILHSNPTAQAKLFIDFNGNAAMSDWLGFQVTQTGAYDTDGNKNDFSTSELADINEIWQRVSEAYSPFNIDVTTQDPGNRDNRRTVQILVGGSVDDWFKEEAGGVAPLGAFYNGAPNVGFVFSDDAFGDTRYIGQAVIHEAGHTFGLYHHSSLTPDGAIDEEYDPGNAAFGPVMGFPIFSERMLWANTAASINGEVGRQDDLAILSGPANGFGYRFDDHGNTRFGGMTLNPDSSGNATASGIIERNTDIDAFNFSAGTGTLRIDLNNAPFAPMLDGSVKVVDPFGTVIAEQATASLDETLIVNITAGTYTVFVSGAGAYGDLGQYTLDMDIPPGADNSDHLLLEGTDFDDNIQITLVEGSYRVDLNGDIRTVDPNTIKQFDILAGGGNDVVTIGPGVAKAYILGGSGNDTLTGGDFSDTITGAAGNDIIFGGEGDDRLAGGAGHDIIVAGNGRDRTYGDAGNDVITGGAGVDRMWGGPDHDVLSGESSADKIYGEAGNDTIYGGNGTDLLNGGDGLDQIWGGNDNDTIYSRDLGFDFVNGGAGDDSAQVDEDEDTQESLETLLA